MEKLQMAEELKKVMASAPRKEAACYIHLFGIQYGEEITEKGYTAKELVNLAELPYGYQSELSKGIRLSKYVEMKRNSHEGT